MIPPEVGSWHGVLRYPCVWVSSQREDALKYCTEEAERQQGPNCPRVCWQGGREAGVPVRPEREMRTRLWGEPWNTLQGCVASFLMRKG